MVMGLIISLAVSFSANAGSARHTDELEDLKSQLHAANSTKDQLAEEIENLERISVERAQKIKELKERLIQARKELSQRMNEAAQQRKHADALDLEMKAIEGDIANVEELEKSELNSLEAMRKAELIKKEQLTQMAAKLNLKRKKHVENRAIAQEQVVELQRENQRLYDQIKARTPTRIRTTGETRPE